MDRLLEIEPVLAEQAYHQVTDLLNLEVDLLFFDTTSTYFETEEADGDIPRNDRGEPVPPGSEDKAGEAGFRTHGKSKDSRDDLPQVIVGMAVTRDGIPVRVWSWPGNTADSGLIRQVKKDLREWTLSKVIWVADRGFTSEQNRRFLMQGGGGYIIGEKLRSGSPDAKAALSRQGRYKTVRDNLQVKEVRLGDDSDRFIICYNPDQAERDDAIRAHVILCWLALLLMRVAENETGRPWNRIRAELQRQHAVTWTGPAGTFRQTTDLTKPLRDLYTALNIEPPKKILALEPAPTAS